MKGHTEAMGIERREFALNGDSGSWMGLLQANVSFDFVERVAIIGMSPGLDQEEHLQPSTESENALVHGDPFGVVEGSVKP